jgi:transcriptional regulator with XRE-family HTH domain
MSTKPKQTQKFFCILLLMEQGKPVPYRQALPFLLKENRWSYRDLDRATGKSASYWNQTVNGKQGIPQNIAVYELLAEIFEVNPNFFAEYAPLKAAQLVLKDPALAYMVIRAADEAKRP